MVSSIDNNTSYSYYVPRSQREAEAGAALAYFASTAVMGAMPYFSKPFSKQIEREVVNNPEYKDVLLKAFDKSGLSEKGVQLFNVKFSPEEEVLLRTGRGSQIQHLDVKLGKNAFYSPSTKAVCLNMDKAAISGFHEIGHAMNHLNSKFGKLLQKSRAPGYAIAGLMGTIALTSRPKPKGENRNAYDFVQDNCGKIALFAMLPVVLEEAMASIKGVKLAKATNASEKVIKSLKNIYGKALLTYGGFAILSGLSVFIASKIMDKTTRPRIVEA